MDVSPFVHAIQKHRFLKQNVAVFPKMPMKRVSFLLPGYYTNQPIAG